MAEHIFRRAAHGRHDARSAGSDPGTEAHPQVVDALREIGLDASGHRPRTLDDDALRWADVVVATCDDACPVIPAKRYISWDLPDPKNQPPDRVHEIRDQIDGHVHELLDELNRPLT